RGQTVDPKELERKAIGKTLFKVESTTVTVAERIQIRKLFQKVGIIAKQGEELSSAPQFLVKLQSLADNAGGEAPKPERPNTKSVDEIRLSSGNEQLKAIYNNRDELTQSIDDWTKLGEQIQKRWPSWLVLKRLMFHAASLQDAEVLQAQVGYIEQQRQLLEEPDLIAPLVANLTQILRDELNRLNQAYQAGHDKGMARLKADKNWQQLEPEQRNPLLAAQKLTLSHA